MTAMNIIVQPTAGAAFLLSDTACTYADGRVGSFHSKVSTISVGRCGWAAISGTGMDAQDYWRAYLRDLRASTLTGFLSALPAIFRAVESILIDRGVPEACGVSHLAAVVGVYDRDAREARGYAISNDRSLFDTSRPGARSYEPYTLQPVRKYLIRFVGAPFSQGTDLTNPAQWNPTRDAAALVDAQRADPFGRLGAQFAGVGGHATLTKVSAAGVEHSVVRRWPDRIGHRINAAAQPRAGIRDLITTSLNGVRAPILPVIRVRGGACCQP